MAADGAGGGRGHDPHEWAQAGYSLVTDPRTGLVVGAQNIVTGAVTKLSPGRFLVRHSEKGYHREAELLSRLPDAQLAGKIGRGVVPRDRNPDGPTTPALQFRPLQGLPQNQRGNTEVIIPVLSKFGIGQTLGSFNHSVAETPKSPGDDAESIIVTLGREYQGQPAGFELPGISSIYRARVIWGIGGAQFETLIDWMAGLSFSLAASFIRISVEGSIGPWFSVDPAPPNPVVAASFGYGFTGGRTSSTKLTVNNVTGLQAHGASRLIDIPRFAQSFTVLPVFDSGFGVNLQLLLESNAAGSDVFATYVYNNLTNSSQQNESTFLIPNGAHNLEIINDGAAFLTEGCGIMWNMSL